MDYEFLLENKVELKNTSYIFDIKFHPDKQNVALVSTVDGNIYVLDLGEDSALEVSLNLEKHHNGSPVRKIGFLDSNTLISTAKSIKIYDLNTGNFTRKIANDNVKIYSLKTLNSNIFFTGDDLGNFKMFDLRQGNEPLMNEKVSADYISDIDIDLSERILLTTSGDGFLTAFNIKSKKLILQSEQFDAGFQSVKNLPHRGKVIVGAEDGALNIFNFGEWGNISDRFPLNKSKLGFGECSVDGINVINDSLIIASSSDSKLRLVQIFPNKVLTWSTDHENSIEALDYNKNTGCILSSETNCVYLHKLVEANDESNDDDDDDNEKIKDDNSKNFKEGFFKDL